MTTGCHQSNTSVTEVIAACAFETFAPEVDQHSFTNALTNTLAIASKGPPFSVAELNSRILSRLRCWTPSLLVDDDGNIRQDAHGEYLFERQPRKTPIYNILCESKNRRSIILTPPTKSGSVSSASSQEMLNASSSSISPPSHIDMATESSKKRKLSEKDKIKWPQVVLSIRLDSAQLEIDTWREYIRSLPAEAKDIKIEGVYRSFSTLLMVRMPVTIWNILPDNGAYSFIGFVTSENLAYDNPRSAYNEDGPLQPDSPPGSSSDIPQHSEGPEDVVDGNETLRGERSSGGNQASGGKELPDAHRDSSTSRTSMALTSRTSMLLVGTDFSSSAAEVAPHSQSSSSNTKISSFLEAPSGLVSEDAGIVGLSKSPRTQRFSTRGFHGHTGRDSHSREKTHWEWFWNCVRTNLMLI
jgi:hypothetical protein